MLDFKEDDKYKEIIFQKENPFLNKKRNRENKNDNIELLGLFNSNNVIDDNLDKKFPNNILINDTNFNSKKLKIDEELSVFPDNKKAKKDITNEITCFSSLKNDETEISKISKNPRNIINIDNIGENLINSEGKEKNEENDLNENFGNKRKDKVPCFSLDLLNENGALQIKYGKEDNTYLLRIKEIEIKDDYFNQIDYAKKYGKNTSCKNSVPNYKFWMQRYYYFSKFDKGIQMDKESWYSVTPEKIAKYTAKLIEGKTIIDGFCGCGGNVIQFSKYCSKVYAVDISSKKLNLCKNNCKIYNCSKNIEFIHSDFLEMKNKIKADYIFLSPPWGGTDYKDSKVYSIKKYMYPDINKILNISLNVADNILFFLPRNLDLDELFDLCSNAKNEIEKNSGKELFFDIQIIRSNNRIKALLIIFGHDVNLIFSKNKLKNYLKGKYENIEEKEIDSLYTCIKKIGYFKFFKEENIFRKVKFKGTILSCLVDYIKGIVNT